METKESDRITFRVSPEELQVIDTKAAETGLNRTDYIRARLFAPNNNGQIAELEKQLHALTDQLGQQVKEADKPQEKPKCRIPEHAQLFGCGHCFICDVNIYVPGH